MTFAASICAGSVQGSIELSADALAPMRARLIRVFHGLLAVDPDGRALDLDVEVFLLHAGQLGDDLEVFAALEHVDGRIRAAPTCERPEPIALHCVVHRALHGQERRERISHSQDHGGLLFRADQKTMDPVVGPAFPLSRAV